MYIFEMKPWYFVCVVACGVFLHRADTLKFTNNAHIEFLEENSDPCLNDPCKNDGICSVNDTDYICNCKQPYMGKQCEIHPCHSNPCLNEGACIAVENTYGCVCNEPFHGRHCENDPCSSNPCKNEGSCNVTGIDFNCICESFYSGKYCEIEITSIVTEQPTSRNQSNTEYFTPEITTNKDQCYCGVNSVSCSLDWTGEKICQCKDNYAPRNEECAATCNSDSDCSHGGRCRREDFEYFCQCIGTYTGDRCETDVCPYVKKRECENMWAECTRKGDSGVCECPEGTTLSRISNVCEDICSYRTCLNGRCEVTGNSSFICICYEGFYGLNCEISSRYVYYFVPWIYVIILSVGIVIFSIASIIAAQWFKKLRKQVEDAKKITIA